MIQLKGIAYRYPASDWILKDIDLTITPNDYLVILGGNGSGKSTLGYLINGFIPEFFGGTLQGSLVWDDLADQDGDSVDRFSRVGLVLQNTDAQLFHSTVSDEMAFGLENLGLPVAEIEKRILATAALLGLDHLLARAPSQLSGGEKRLAAIAAVLCLNPALLILDEPFANLDWQGCRRVQNMLRNIHQGGTIVMVIEQRLGPFLRDATRCCILKRGRVLFEGRPTQAPAMLSKENLRPHYPRRLPPGPPAGEVLLNVRDLSCRVGQREILSNISFDVKKGETIAIIGKNGAGKTTLIKHFNGLMRPASGEIRLLGQAIGGRAPAHMAGKVGLSFQNPNDQFFKSRVKEELMVGPQMLGQTDVGWIDHISAVFDLQGLLTRSPYGLSEGEKKRVALCAIFSMQSDLVVLDEPTAGQDGRFREALAGFLAVLEDLGLTILIVTHDLDFAKATTDRWIVLDKGRITADGSPGEICGDLKLAEAGIIESIQETEERREEKETTGVSDPVEFHSNPNALLANRLKLQFDPRTKLLLGLMAMAAILMARHPQTIVAEGILVLVSLPLGKLTRPWLRSMRLMLPMLALLFAVSYIAFDLQVASLLTLRLCSLYTLSMILFSSISPAEMGAALQKMGMPYEFSFILTTALHYVPLMGQRIGHIMDAQQSRGIDLQLRLKNAGNFLALLAPLLIQSFLLADELAMAMQLRGFGSKTRTIRQQYRLTAGDYLLLVAGTLALIALLGWERR